MTDEEKIEEVELRLSGISLKQVREVFQEAIDESVFCRATDSGFSIGLGRCYIAARDKLKAALGEARMEEIMLQELAKCGRSYDSKYWGIIRGTPEEQEVARRRVQDNLDEVRQRHEEQEASLSDAKKRN